MNLQEIDYRKLYNLQDKVFACIGMFLDNFYLTGGTALSRYYLSHRHSDDLDFFVNSDLQFKSKVEKIYNVLKKEFLLDDRATIQADEFVRIVIKDVLILKIDFVNDIAYRYGEPLIFNNFKIDNITNILANKLTAIVSRDEPKDVMDLLTISQNFSFNWPFIYQESLKKQLLNEQDIAMRLETFPVELFIDKPWLKKPVDLKLFKENLDKIIDDFILAQDNSLGKGKPAIENAKILTQN